MRRSTRRLALGAAVALAAGLSWMAATRDAVAPDDGWNDSVPRRGSPGEAADFFLAQRVPDGEALPMERYEAALDMRAAMPRLGAATRSKREKLGPTAWLPVGPAGVGGRTRALLIDPTRPDVLYAGGVSGGVWKSIDGAASWQPAGLLSLGNLAVATLAFHPDDTDTLFAGTGEGVYVGRPVTRSRGVRGNGIFVSEDAGSSWRHLASTRGNADFDFVNRLVFDGEGRLHAATRAGLFVSADDGATWTRGLAPPNPEGCAELVFVPLHGRMLASCGVFSQSALYRSDDGGASWTPMALPAGSGRTTLAVSTSDPSVVYAFSAHAADYAFTALHRSDDGGATWQLVIDRASADPLSKLVLSNPFAQTDAACELVDGPSLGQGWFDNTIAVDPLDADVVYVGGVDLFRSDDGGRSFRILSRWWSDPARPDYVHADQHAIVFDPRYDGVTHTRMYVANDGGVHMTDAPRGPASDAVCGSADTPDWNVLNKGYLVTQFYDGAVSADGSRLIGGTQDNGTHLGSTLETPWREVFGGDGGVAAIDPRDPGRYYVSTPYAFFQRTDDDGTSFVPLRNGLPGAISNYLFIAPFAIDPNQPDVLWTGAGARVYRSADRGDTWHAVQDPPVHPNGGLPSAIAIAANAPGRVAFGWDNGTIARTLDAGNSWQWSRPRDGFVSSLAFDPHDASVLYATYSTFGGSHVQVSRDGGASFTASDGAPGFTLPDVPAHTILVDPRQSSVLWVGTDIGLFVSPDGGQRWYADDSGLGSVLIEKLVVAGSGEDAALVAFTYGRGALRAPLSALPVQPFNAGYAGAWYEPATAGQGLFIEAIPDGDSLAIGWYTWRDAGQEWLVGTGVLENGRAELSLFRVTGGRFDGDAQAPQPAGALVLDFHGCSTATGTYDITLDGTRRTGSMALQRLTSAQACEQFRAYGDAALSQLAVPAAPGHFEYGHSGSWADATAQSQGFFIDVDPAARSIVAGWYTFDPAAAADAAPAWYTAQGALDGAVATLTLFRTSGGTFDAPAAVQSVPAGTLTLEARSCSTIDAEYALELPGGDIRTGSFALSRITAPTVCEAMAP